MTDDIFMEAIKCAIVKAFFEPIYFYENNNGCQYTRTVGGQGAQITEAVLGKIKLDELAQDIAVEVMKNKEAIFAHMKANVAEVLFSKTYGESKVRPEVLTAVAKAVEVCLSNDERFAELIIGRLNLKDAKITITVKVE